MTSMLRVVGLAMAACAGVVVIVWLSQSHDPTPDYAPAASPRDSVSGDLGPGPLRSSIDADPDLAPLDARPDAAPDATTIVRQPPPQGSAGGRHDRAPESAWSWPTPRGGRRAAGGVTAPGEPSVPTRIAFRALWYLGVDPQAERTWSRAINDPNMPPGVRSDLIVDMIDEGYTDNNHPTKADLPVSLEWRIFAAREDSERKCRVNNDIVARVPRGVSSLRGTPLRLRREGRDGIVARLELIERYAPYAMDEINRVAFEEAYRHLLEMYLRLGGQPRDAR